MTTKDGDKVQSEMLAAVARYRAIDGERMFNHFLRNMLAQSNKVLRDHGLVIAEDQQIADLEMQLHKARTESATAAAYANHFGSALRSVSKSKEIPASLASSIKGHLEWTPDKAAPAIEPERATH